MRAIVKKNQRKGFDYIDMNKPKPKSNEVLIEVKVATICGTDMHYFNWDQMASGFAEKYKVNFPFIVGHECAGTIIEVGSQVKNREVGQRVAIETHIPCGVCYACQTEKPHNCSNMKVYGTSCNGCFAEYTTVDERATFVLPEEITFEEGALLEPAGVAMRAVEECKIVPGECVVVCGCGPIGLMIVQILKASGAACIIAVDKDKYRLCMAEQFGAITVNIEEQNVIEKTIELTGVRGGADVLIEASGSVDAYSYIFDLVRSEGRIITVGHPGTTVEIDVMKSVNIKGLSIKGIFGRRIWGTWWNLISLIKHKKINLLEIITHQYYFEDYEKAFAQVHNGAGKVILVKGDTNG